MVNKHLIVISVEENPELNLEELCRACDVTPDFIHNLIDYGIIEPKGFADENWRFDAEQVRRVRIITRLQHDLEVNIAGAALVLDLMDQMEKMRSRLELFDRYFK